MTLSETASGKTVADITTNKNYVEEKSLAEEELSNLDYIWMAEKSLTSPVLTGKGISEVNKLFREQEDMENSNLYSRGAVTENAEMTSNIVTKVIEKDISEHRKNLTVDEVQQYMNSVLKNYIRNMQIIWEHLQAVTSLGLGNISFETLIQNSNLMKKQAVDQPIIESIQEINDAFTRIVDMWRVDKSKVPTQGWSEYNQAILRFTKEATNIIKAENNKKRENENRNM